MAFIRAQIVLAHDSGLPEDVAVNTLYFTTQSTPALSIELDPIDTAIDTFYNFSGTSILSSKLTGSLVIKYYDLADAEPRVPVRTSTLAFTPGGGAQVEEVALCMSYHSAIESGDIAARHRGRIYLGPLSSSTDVTGTAVRPPAGWIVDIANAAEALLVASDASALWAWQQFSPTTVVQGGTLATAFNLVDGGWVDNAFDTQRRRGAAPTVRTLWP